MTAPRPDIRAIRIADASDPRIAAYLSVRERDLTGRQGRFVAEGKVVLAVLFQARRFAVESVLVLENRLDGIADTLAGAPADMPVYVASQDVIDAIAGFHIHRGILAIGVKRAPAGADELLATLPRRALVAVMIGLSNHDNVGSIFRNAAAFGADAVILDGTSCDPLYRKAIRVSVGGVFRVPFAIEPSAAAIPNILARNGFGQVALSPRGQVDLRAAGRGDRLALYLGTEGEGLPQPLMSTMTTVRIGMAADFDSLNVASASAIAMHHFTDAGRS